jgi:triphosphoribosyl-dephospho-CoA synthetase
VTRAQAKRERRQRRIAAREPGTARHLRALRRHFRLGGNRPKNTQAVEDEIEFARIREAKRLLDHGSRLSLGAERMDKLVAATRPQEG